MTVPPSPVVASWELALRLKQRRNELNISVETVTKALGFTRNYWSAVENERKLLSSEALKRVLDLFRFEAHEKAELRALRAAARERGWWSAYSALFDADIQRLFGLEHGARAIRDYESLLIPGLLQTADYIRAIMMPAVTLPQVEVDQRVEARLHRQARLADPNDSFTLTAVISEAALRQQIGGRNVLRQQLMHLAELIESHERKLDVRVIPFTATECGLFGAATVHLIEFENPQLPTLAWQESVTAWGVINDPIQVRDITTTYEEAYRTTAAPRNQTLQIIRDHIREL
ncbi:Scr1 family TA system antitoxin-like transcriptional regulator [Amycolatopsis mongoliensis]|uniref:Scr1 family TA system antitoxin-like transcriptional regulator n=1 Tax=Amycolatopsis mongoliensis TaxID=715475 RepID=A0A9Y2NKR1_9PSEU|nr:Scr1 family TA system antitoxin-like transcriptional regulator [Amycolatopsis sp. 4-36]WIY03063.1 Scr1 family TA system antitoxin-like transcriptional regulator [Amycolatopsis sp. 4-36]